MKTMCIPTRTCCSGAWTPCSSTTCWPRDAGVLSALNGPLRDRIDAILRDAMRDGTLEAIFRKWHVWNDDQQPLYDRLLRGERVEPVSDLTRGSERDEPTASAPDAGMP